MSNYGLRILLAVSLAVAIGFAVAYRDAFDVDRLQSWLDDAGVFAPLLFMLIYAVATVLFLPGSVMTLAGGALFGPVWGSIYNLTGATAGAAVAFLIARYLASDWVANKTGGKVRQLIDGVEQEGWRFVAFVRLAPVFPFNLLNYALGLTRIPFLQYLWATYVFMLPGAIAYTWLGYTGREAVSGGENMIQNIMIALALLAAVSFLPRLLRRMRTAMVSVDELKQKLDAGQDVLVLDVRDESEFHGEQGHIPGARLLPLEQLQQRMAELAEYKTRPLVTICRTDRKSTTAARLLADNGFENVCVVKMGMTDWNRHQYPVEK